MKDEPRKFFLSSLSPPLIPITFEKYSDNSCSRSAAERFISYAQTLDIYFFITQETTGKVCRLSVFVEHSNIFREVNSLITSNLVEVSQCSAVESIIYEAGGYHLQTYSIDSQLGGWVAAFLAQLCIKGDDDKSIHCFVGLSRCGLNIFYWYPNKYST